MIAINPAVNHSRRLLLPCCASIVRALAIAYLITTLAGQIVVRADDEASTVRHVVFLTQKGKDKANEILAEELREETGFKCRRFQRSRCPT